MDENQKLQHELSTQGANPDEAPSEQLDDTPAEASATVGGPVADAPAVVTGDNLEVSSKKKVYLTTVIVIVLLGAAGAIWYLYGWNKPALPKVAVSSPTPHSRPVPATVSSVPSRLFAASGDENGVAVGYLAAPLAAASGSWLVGSANAAGSQYQAAVFYSKPVSGTNQIFALDVSTKTTSQLTTDQNAASIPVFSSVSQNLAYESSYPAANSSGGRCDLLTKNLTSGTTAAVASQGTNVCYTPIAWSPDGTKLLYASVDNVLTAADWGLVNLYVYQAGQPATQLKPPAGNNSLGGFRDAVWADSNTVEARYINKQQVGGNTLSQALYSVNVTSGVTAPVTSPIDGDLQSIQISQTDQYFITGTPTAAVAEIPGSGTGAGAKKVIVGTAGAGTYLLQFAGSAQALSNIVFVTGQPGQQNAMQIDTVPISGGTATKVFAPTGYSAYLLGWAGDYNQVLYMAVLSGQSDIRLYNLSANTDTDLVPGLSLVQ